MNLYTVEYSDNGFTPILDHVEYEQVADWLAEGNAGIYRIVIHPDPNDTPEEDAGPDDYDSY